MQFPTFFQGESLTRLMQGAVAGFLATVVIGFGWGGWTLGNAATKMAEQSAKNAVVSVLAPICVDNFQHATAAKATLAELKATDSWKQDTFIAKGGWTTFPGMEAPNNNVAEACAKMLNALKHQRRYLHFQLHRSAQCARTGLEEKSNFLRQSPSSIRSEC